MAKVAVDETLCTGCGLCEGTCPEVFKVMEDNLAHVIAQGCKGCDLKQAAADCPVEAITVR
ncbi:MAG: ferredoxin [Candidatus Omnitrophica bacterium]|nr:ferredoxin [Candidatus Omnitrophota bacterium]